jgi:hypothetical protein
MSNTIPSPMFTHISPEASNLDCMLWGAIVLLVIGLAYVWYTQYYVAGISALGVIASKLSEGLDALMPEDDDDALPPTA